MGITGTDVAKEAADMIVTDDNYATIVSAVEEGRIIYENMKASIKYLLGSNIGEIISLLGGALLGWPFILLPIQILYIYLITDGLPALSLALNNKHRNIMNYSPRRESELFNKYDYRWFMEVSVLTGVSTLVAFWIGWKYGDLDLGRTLAFVVIALAQQYIFLDIAAGAHTIISRTFLHNRWIIIPVSFMIFQILLAHTDWFQKIFHIVTPHWIPLLGAIAICTSMVITAELRKRFAKHYFYES
jgi:Ca2+-transporting ATPase